MSEGSIRMTVRGESFEVLHDDISMRDFLAMLGYANLDVAADHYGARLLERGGLEMAGLDGAGYMLVAKDWTCPRCGESTR
jgi:hypothetical protein